MEIFKGGPWVDRGLGLTEHAQRKKWGRLLVRADRAWAELGVVHEAEHEVSPRQSKICSRRHLLNFASWFLKVWWSRWLAGYFYICSLFAVNYGEAFCILIIFSYRHNA